MKTFKYKPALFLRIFTNMKTFKHNTFEIGSRNLIAFNDKQTISKNSGRKFNVLHLFQPVGQIIFLKF